jgi:hypothetical protein
MKKPIDRFIEEVQADAEFFGRTFNKPEVVTYEYGDGSGSKGLAILPRDGLGRRFNVTIFGNAQTDHTPKEEE